MLESARGGFCSSHVCAQGAKADPLTSVTPRSSGSQISSCARYATCCASTPPPPLAPKRSVERRGVNVMQQGGEAGLDGRTGRRVHPGEIGSQGDPALCPDPAPPRLGSFRAGPFPRRVSLPSTASSVL